MQWSTIVFFSYNRFNFNKGSKYNIPLKMNWDLEKEIINVNFCYSKQKKLLFTATFFGKSENYHLSTNTSNHMDIFFFDCIVVNSVSCGIIISGSFWLPFTKLQGKFFHIRRKVFKSSFCFILYPIILSSLNWGLLVLYYSLR